MTVSNYDYEAGLEACATGDQSAFLSLYQQEAPAMYALATQMLDDAAEPVVLETFVLIWRNASGYSRALGEARAWMYSILRYRAFRRLRQAPAVARAVPSLPALQAKPEAGPVSQVIATLPQVQAEALLQAYLHGGDCAHIAGRLDRSEPDVRASIEAALAAIDAAVRV